MKAATAELISLLASSKQFVMWEEFTFTLADGTTQIVYSTVDPDAPPVPLVQPPPPPPPAGDAWLLDTFTSDEEETLAVHVGEVGATWSTGTGGYPEGPSGFQVIDGVTSVPSGDTGQVRASGLPPDDSSDYYMELELFLASNVTASFSSTRVSGFKGFQLECSTFSGSNIAVATYGSTDAETFSNSTDSGMAFPGSAVAWVTVTGGRKVVRYGLGSGVGDNQLAEYTFADALPTVDAVQMVMFGPFGDATASRIEGGALPWLLDTFSGTGNLSTHVGEIGATWSSESSDTADFELIGDGFVEFVSVGASTGGVTCSGLPPDGTISSYYVEANFVIPASAVGVGTVGFYVGVFNIATENFAFEVRVSSAPDSGTISLYALLFAGEDFDEHPTADTGFVVSNSPILLRAELSGAGSVLDVTLDGIPQATLTLAGGPPSSAQADTVYFELTKKAGESEPLMGPVQGGTL